MIQRFETFVGLISQLQKDIQKMKNIEMQEFGLKGPHVMCLYYLNKHQTGLTATQLCKLASVDKAAISRILADLFEKGYIYYPEKQEGKKYKASAVLTEAGTKIAMQVTEIICTMVASLGDGITEEERICMYRSLEKISENINHALQKVKP